MKISLNNLLAGLLFLISSFSLNAQCVDFYLDESFDGPEMLILVDVRVDNFDDIVSMQMAFGYSSADLELQSIVGNTPLGINNSNFNAPNSGYIAFLWSDAIGSSLPDGESIFQLRFKPIGPNPSSIVLLNQHPLPVEIINGDIEENCYTFESITINEPRAIIKGNILHDLDQDCIQTSGDKPLNGWKVQLTSPDNTYFAITDESGYYSRPVPLQDYTVEVLPINNLWTPCVIQEVITADTEGELYDASFMISPSVESSALSVTIKAQRLRRCFDNTMVISYQNNGTIDAVNTEITILIDDNLDFVDANINGLNVDGQTLTLFIGALESGASGTFNITVNVNCDNTVLGETLCAEAVISADDSLIPPSEWDGAVLTTEIECEGDSIAVTITNIGVQDVSIPLNFIVIEDDVMFHSNQTDPNMNQQQRFTYDDRGGTYRIVADQPIGYPLGTFETAFVQSCDDDNGGSYQFVSMFPNADEAPIRDVECHEVIGSYDPNDILAYPAGYRENHIIDANQDIEYTIRFQNTGTDTAFNISIENPIDDNLNFESITFGGSSHPYVVSVLDSNTLRFDFYNILLPDSTSNLAASNGFLSYKVAQLEDLPVGSTISNTADIYFDFNDAIVTNTYTHQIGEEYIEIILDNKLVLLDNELLASPNPSSDIIRIEVPESLTNVSYILYNNKGMVINAANCHSNAFYINKGMMISGLYILEVRSNDVAVGRKKLVFH